MKSQKLILEMLNEEQLVNLYLFSIILKDFKIWTLKQISVVVE